MKRFFFLLYGVIAYFLFFGTILYAIGFIGNIVVPKGIDGIPEVALLQAVITNTVLLLLFAVPHSVMARKSFKRWWTTIIPSEIERSTYVLISSLLLLLVFWKWEPMGGVIWTVEAGFLQGFLFAIFALGWVMVFASTFLINHFDLFGLRQVWLAFQNKPYTNLKFGTPLLYQMVRHPLYLGFLLAFWATPTMTVTHLLFAVACTGYIFVGMLLEEKDLVAHFGESYLNYRKSVPMIFPNPFKKKIKTKAAPVYEVLEN